MTAAIRAWLNGNRQYAEGLLLYQQYGSDPDLLQRLQAPESESLRKELFFALRNLLKPAAPAADPVPAPPKKALKNPEPVADQPPSPIAAAAKREADRLYKEMQNVRAELFAQCPVRELEHENEPGLKKERGQLAARVIELQQLVDRAYADYRFALQHGRLPQAEPEAPVISSPVQLHQQISNLRKSLSKDRNRPEQTPAVMQRIADKETLLKTLLDEYQKATAH